MPDPVTVAEDAAGASGWIEKPVTANQLPAQVNVMLHRQDGGTDAAD